MVMGQGNGFRVKLQPLWFYINRCDEGGWRGVRKVKVWGTAVHRGQLGMPQRTEGRCRGMVT